MKRIFLLGIMLGSLLLCYGQTTAMKVLDQAAAKFKVAGSWTVGYNFSMNGQQGQGTILMSGQKFRNDLGDPIVWFDGKTMWTLVKANDEVNVTEPTPQEIASMNPYAFVSMYKNGYKASFGKSTKQYHEIILTPNTKAGQGRAKQIVLRLAKSSLQPCYVSMTDSDGNVVTIHVTSFKSSSKMGDSTFRFHPKSYPDVEVVDLR